MGSMEWLSRAEAVALGWTLLHFCWQGTVVAVVYALVDRMTIRASSAARYAVVVGALALMPLAVMATYAVEMRAPAGTASQAGAAISRAYDRVMLESMGRPSSTEVAAMVEQPREWLADHVEPMLPWVDSLWVVGVLLLALRALGGWVQLEQLRRRARGVVPAEVEAQFRRIRERMRVGGRLSLRISDEVISPLAMGVWRATVILPVSAVLRMPASELEAVLAHELGHIRRWDYLTNLMQTAVESVLFFHPAVWWLSRTVRERREVCCDEIAVAICADPVVYAQALLRLEEEKTTRLALAMAFQGSKGLLFRRIRQVLGEGMSMESGMTSGVRVAVAGVVLAGLLFGPKVRQAVASPTAEAAPAVLPQEGTESSALPEAKPGAAQPLETRQEAKDASGTEVPAPAAPSAGVRVAVQAEAAVTPEIRERSEEETPPMKGTAFLDGMRAAGYALDLKNDLDTLVAMRSLGVTPEYANAMGALGYGKPSAQELISLKALGVTPEYVESMKKSGLAPKDLHEAISEKAMGITPEYAAAMKQAGLGDLNPHELVSLKAQGMTPEYAQWLKREFPQITTEELRRAAVFHIDEKFVASARSHGFDGKDLEKLLRLKISGLLDE